MGEYRNVAADWFDAKTEDFQYNYNQVVKKLGVLKRELFDNVRFSAVPEGDKLHKALRKTLKEYPSIEIESTSKRKARELREQADKLLVQAKELEEEL